MKAMKPGVVVVGAGLAGSRRPGRCGRRGSRVRVLDRGHPDRGPDGQPPVRRPGGGHRRLLLSPVSDPAFEAVAEDFEGRELDRGSSQPSPSSAGGDPVAKTGPLRWAAPGGTALAGRGPGRRPGRAASRRWARIGPGPTVDGTSPPRPCCWPCPTRRPAGCSTTRLPGRAGRAGRPVRARAGADRRAGSERRWPDGVDGVFVSENPADLDRRRRPTAGRRRAGAGRPLLGRVRRRATSTPPDRATAALGGRGWRAALAAGARGPGHEPACTAGPTPSPTGTRERGLPPGIGSGRAVRGQLVGPAAGGVGVPVRGRRRRGARPPAGLRPGRTGSEVSGQLSVEHDLVGRHALRGERGTHGGTTSRRDVVGWGKSDGRERVAAITHVRTRSARHRLSGRRRPPARPAPPPPARRATSADPRPAARRTGRPRALTR